MYVPVNVTYCIQMWEKNMSWSYEIKGFKKRREEKRSKVEKHLTKVKYSAKFSFLSKKEQDMVSRVPGNLSLVHLSKGLDQM